LVEAVLAWAARTADAAKGDLFLVGFNDQVIISTETTTDATRLHRALEQLHPLGGSAIRDSIIHSTQKFYALGPEPQPTGRVIVLVSDGYDNASRSKEQEAIESAQWFGVRIYAISFPSPESASGKGFLTNLTKSTGGMAYFPSDEVEANVALKTIGRDLSNSFLLGFISEAHDARFHNFTVEFSNLANRPLRTLQKVYAPSVR
jgi:hypothetical protein